MKRVYRCYHCQFTPFKSLQVISLPVKQKNPHNPSVKRENSTTKNRPCTVQATPNESPPQFVDYRLIKSPTLRRKAYSAGITPKTNRQTSPVMERMKKVTQLSSKVATAPADVSKRDKESQQLPKKSVTETLKTMKKLPQLMVRQTSTSATTQRQK